VTELSRISKPRLAISRTRRHARTPISTAFIPVVVSIPTLVLIAVLIAQEAIAPYCSDLKRAADLAMTSERFASISAK
jgi:hypothetical protein